MRRLRRFVFLILLGLLSVSFFARNNYKSVHEIVPAVLAEPIQQPIYYQPPIRFTIHGYDYELTPVATYDISALLVSKINYKSFSIYEYERAVPVDLVMIWGDNVKNEKYKEVQFYNDMGWGWWRSYVDTGFNSNQFSNNHLVIGDRKNFERKASSLLVGDQVRIRGKLINMTIHRSGSSPAPEDPVWKSSLTRTDTAAGACEVIYPEEIEVIKKANREWDLIFKFSFWALVILALISAGLFFFRTDGKYDGK
jgi:hypothetical protein